MTDSASPPDPKTGRSPRTMVLIMLGIIIASIAAFLILRPNPSGSPPTTNPTSQH